MYLLPLFLVFICTDASFAARVLLLPFDHKGHANTFSAAGKQLKERGHHVVILTPERNRHIVERAGVQGIFKQPTIPSPAEDYKNIEESILLSGIQQFFQVIKLYTSLTENFLEFCREVMADTQIMDKLRAEKFDIALMDGSALGRCLYVIAYKLDIPYLSLNPVHEPWRVGIPAMPSSEGFIGFVLLDSDSSLFLRLKNLGLYLMLYYTSIVHEDKHIKELAPEMPATTYHALYTASGVHFVNMDNTCMDYPRLEAPHYRFIGGLGASPARPLAEPFATFVNSAEYGLIVVSFGSFIKRLPDPMMQKMMLVFKQLKQKVVMRYDGEFEGVPDNVLLSKWLPQNDLLGHNNTRLFIAHGGVNGQMEGLYHGVPMIVMPLGGDQQYNGKRAESKRFGKMLQPFTFTSDMLQDAITEILSNDEFSRNMKKCSRISKSFPNAHETIHFWIEHVLEFGSDHLKPVSLNMPLWKLFMFDVLLLLLVIDLILCYFTFKCCKCCYRRCQGRGGKAKED